MVKTTLYPPCTATWTLWNLRCGLDFVSCPFHVVEEELIYRDDYLSTPAVPQAGPSRHGGFEMSHDAMGVTVSSNVRQLPRTDVPQLTRQEAKRLDSLTRDTLLTNRKLSLIVDLDQTIIHTTVDPTVGEWMAEIERDEEEEIAPPTLSTDPEGTGKGKEREEGETTTPPGSPRPAKRKREPNPNAEALKDVARFTLADDPAPGQGRRKVPERYYYTKPRFVHL
jgi:RNA polymerase II subunit A-like phosphatase